MIVRDHAAEMRSVVDALVARLDVLQPDLPPPADSTATAPVERVFRFTQTSHEALHALLAGNGGAGTPDLGTVFARLRRVQADLAAPEFGTEIFVRR
jgi:hypothetical protein